MSRNKKPLTFSIVIKSEADHWICFIEQIFRHFLLFVAIQLLINYPVLCQVHPVDFVDPFIGTGGHGHTYPGATTPWGMVQLSPDTRTTTWDGCSGYHYSDSVILGFSHTHLSGTGVGDLGDILLMPATGNTSILPKDSLKEGYSSRFSHDKEEASPGYYSVVLDKSSVQVELTATTHAGFHRYSYPRNGKIRKLILDLAHGIHGNKSFVSKIEILNDSTVAGYRFSTGWAELKKIFFVIRFSNKITESGISLYNQERLRTIPVALSKEPVRGLFTFQSDTSHTLMVKVALSANSIEEAEEHLKEIPDWNFDRTRKDAKTIWNKYLSKIEVEGGRKEKVIFYTSLYHNLVVPNIISGSHQQLFGPDLQHHSTINQHSYYSTFSLWDTFRSTHPLYTILFPDMVSCFINNFLTHFDLYGYLPIWPLWGTETHTMIGNHSIPVIAEAMIKNIEGFDYQKAYEAVKSSSLINHPNCYFDTLSKYGYLPSDRASQSVSKTLEIAYDDACAALIADKLGKKKDLDYFRNRSLFFRNIFDGSTGFMRGRDHSGKWTTPFDPYKTSYSGDYTEGNAWHYTFFVPHAIDQLIKLYGGAEKLEHKLDTLFNTSAKLTGDVIDVTGLIGQYAHGNEPSHHVAYLYNYTGAYHKTQHYIEEILSTQYSDQPDGLSGNEDCGQMSAWYIFSALGFYPVDPASGSYQLGKPMFKKAVLHLNNGKDFTILSNLKHKNSIADKVILNGKVMHKRCITHQDILQGSILHFKE